MIESVDHIGIAVRSLDEATIRFERILGQRCSGVETVLEQGVRVAFFSVGGVRVELLEALSATSPVARFIEKHGEGIHHLAFRSSDVSGDVDSAKAAGCEHLEGVGANGAGGARVAFLHPKTMFGVLVEICGGHTD